MTGGSSDAVKESKRYKAVLDMAEFAEAAGFDFINLEEHHCSKTGWLGSPLTLASMIAARTSRIRIGVTALLVTLYDPIRLAEDIVVIDLVSGGRFSFVAGMGYRPIEYHAMDKDWHRRGALMNEMIETLLKAWTGKPFEYKGQTVQVSPVPLSQPHPFFFVGGMSSAAAKRAAKFGLPFYPATPRPDLEKIYHEELKKHGKQGFVYSPDQANTMTFIDKNPTQAWQELGPYFLKEMQEYSSWKADGIARPSEDEINTIEDIQQSGRFEIITPEQCLDRMKNNRMKNNADDTNNNNNSDTTLVLHPLAGGIPIERAWDSLKLVKQEVIDKLKK